MIFIANPWMDAGFGVCCGHPQEPQVLLRARADSRMEMMYGDDEKVVGSILMRSAPSSPTALHHTVPAETRFKPLMGHLNQNFLLPTSRCNRLFFCSQVSPLPLTLALHTRPQELVKGLFLCGSFPAALLQLSHDGRSGLVWHARRCHQSWLHAPDLGSRGVKIPFCCWVSTCIKKETDHRLGHGRSQTQASRMQEVLQGTHRPRALLYLQDLACRG